MTSLLSLTHLRLEEVVPDIVSMILDDPAKSANVLTSGLHQDLEAGLDFLDQLPNLKGVILTSAKPRIFVAGADLVNISRTLAWPKPRIEEFCFHGQRLYNRFRERQYVSVAAIRGACVGGGWELALGCDFQLAADEPKTFFGLPEVKLGLVPGWAGTVRLPRLIGIGAALDLITSGRNLSVTEARELGLLAAVVPAGDLLAAAVRQIGDSLKNRDHLLKRIRDLEPVHLPAEEARHLESDFLGRIAANSAIHPFAPTVVAQHLLASCTQPFDVACASEATAMTKVYGSPASHGLLNHYFLGEHNRRRPGWLEANSAAEAPQHLGVVGLGVMGRAILQAAARKSTAAIGYDPFPDAAAATRQLATDRKLAIEVAESLARLSASQIVIEAVVERANTKREVLGALCQIIPAESILATNTSTICLRELVPSVTCPERFCGIHFCHPTLMQLVEVIRGELTAESTVAAAVQWVRGLGKTPVVVKDAPGFVVNRVLSAFLDAALQLAVEGHSIAEIDSGIRTFGFQAGPFEMMDLIGLETTALAGQALLAAGVQRVSRLPAPVKLIHQGRLGRKNCQGFYRYATPDGSAESDPIPETVLDAYRRRRDSSGNSPGPAEEIAPRIMAAALLAALEVWEAGTVRDPRDLDLCVIQGLSFPVHEGGLLFWAGRRGPEALQAALTWAINLHPEATIPKRLVEWQAGRQPFYSST